MSNLSNNTFFGSGIYIPLKEPEIRRYEIIKHKVTSDGIEVLYYLDGQGKEIFDKIEIDTIRQWAIDNKDIFVVWELPFYDPESDEEYLAVYPPTSEMGTADEINENRLARFLKSIDADLLERFYESRK